MPDVGRQYEDTARSDREDTVVTVQLAGPRDDVLGLLGLIGVPAEPASRLDFEDDRRRLVRPVSPIGNEGALPTNCIVTISVDLRAAGQTSRLGPYHPFHVQLARTRL